MQDTIALAIFQIYLQPLEKLIDRKAAYYLALSERDPFAMPEDEARRHQRRLQELAEEVQLLDNVTHSITALSDAYHEKLFAAEKTIAAITRDYISLAKDFRSIQQAFLDTSDSELILLHLWIQNIENRRAA